MSDSENTESAASDETAGKDLIIGPIEVTLVVNLPEGVADTPADAVDQMILAITKRGLGNFFYQVREREGGETWFVRDGHIITGQGLGDLMEEVDSGDRPSE